MGKITREEIKKIIPHREPMLLVDAVEKTGENTCSGYYTVKGDEFFLQGHFPGNPVVPGVILCEMLAQSTCLLFDPKGATPYFTSLDKVKFRSMVKPGDTVRFDCSIVRQNGVFYFSTGKGYVGDKMCVSADMAFALIKKEE